MSKFLLPGRMNIDCERISMKILINFLKTYLYRHFTEIKLISIYLLRFVTIFIVIHQAEKQEGRKFEIFLCISLNNKSTTVTDYN